MEKVKEKIRRIIKLYIEGIQWLCSILLDYLIIAIDATRVLILITLNALLYLVFTLLLWLLKVLKELKKII
jgi:hypothetical protein